MFIEIEQNIEIFETNISGSLLRCLGVTVPMAIPWTIPLVVPVVASIRPALLRGLRLRLGDGGLLDLRLLHRKLAALVPPLRVVPTGPMRTKTPTTTETAMDSSRSRNRPKIGYEISTNIH